MTETTESTDLNTIIPVYPEISISGETVTIRRLKVKHLSLILQSIAPLITVLRVRAPDIKDKAALNDAVTELLLTNPDEVLQIVAICTEKDLKWVHDLELDDAIQLVMLIVEVNLDFFIQRLLPSVLQAVARFKPPSGDGQTLSSV